MESAATCDSLVEKLAALPGQFERAITVFLNHKECWRAAASFSLQIFGVERGMARASFHLPCPVFATVASDRFQLSVPLEPLAVELQGAGLFDHDANEHSIRIIRSMPR
jgi:hypothetical protein